MRITEALSVSELITKHKNQSEMNDIMYPLQVLVV